MKIRADTLTALALAAAITSTAWAQSVSPRRVPVAPDAAVPAKVTAVPAAPSDPEPANPDGAFTLDGRAGTRVFLKDGNMSVHALTAVNVKKEKGSYLGTSVSPATPALRAQLGLKPGFGLVVESVEPDSPANAAGVKRFDVLTKLDDQQLVNADQYLVLIRAKNPGDSLNLTLLREGKLQTITAKTVEKDVSPISDLVTGANNSVFNLSSPWAVTSNVTNVAPVSENVRQTYGLLVNKSINAGNDPKSKANVNTTWRGYAKKQILDEASAQTWTFFWNNGPELEWNYKENGNTYTGVSPLIDADQKDLTLPEQVKTALDAYLAKKKTTLSEIIQSITPASPDPTKTLTPVSPGF